jgi:hypothetical protein
MDNINLTQESEVSADSYEYGNDIFGAIKYLEILEYLSYWWLLKEELSPFLLARPLTICF